MGTGAAASSCCAHPPDEYLKNSSQHPKNISEYLKDISRLYKEYLRLYKEYLRLSERNLKSMCWQGQLLLAPLPILRTIVVSFELVSLALTRDSAVDNFPTGGLKHFLRCLHKRFTTASRPQEGVGFVAMLCRYTLAWSETIGVTNDMWHLRYAV